MVEHNIRGSLVAVGSMYLAGHVVRANYRASKAGVLAMAMSAAIDLAEYGIRVNTLAPGAHTRMSVSSGAKAGAGPDDVAPMGVYLLSDLSADVTGQVFSAGGHRIAGWSDPYENRVVSSDSDWTPEIIAREMPYLLGRDTYRELSLKLPVPSPFRYLPASDAHDAS